MSKRTVIVSGGILEKEFVLPILQSEETEFIIGVDKGLQFLYENEIKPDYIVGDFDSVPREIVEYYRTEENVPIREFNPVKMLSFEILRQPVMTENFNASLVFNPDSNKERIKSIISS